MDDIIAVCVLVFPDGTLHWMEENDEELDRVVKAWRAENIEYSKAGCTWHRALLYMPRGKIPL